jgi:hypothetical protein
MPKQFTPSPRALNARAILAACGIEPEQDFHALRSSQLRRLLAEADRLKYRTTRSPCDPMSRARYFHAYVLRSMNAQGQATEPDSD